MARLIAQVLALLGISFVLGVGANALRSEGVDWRGSDPERFRHADVDFLRVPEAAALHESGSVKILFLDARAPADFAQRHVFGAVSMPADDMETAYEELRDFLDADMTLVVYAGDSMLAVRVAKFLNARGYAARVLEGGWEAWQERRLPVE